MTQMFLLIDSRSGVTTEVMAHKNGKGWKALCPFHDDQNPSLSIDEENRVYHCFGCDAKGKIAADYHSASVPKSKRKVIAGYDYKDESEELLYQVLRYEPKGFSFRRPDGKGGWIYNLDGVQRVPYRLPELLASTASVFIAEGEKDVETVRRFGLTATTNAGGAGKWQTEFSGHLKNRDVVLVPDNDTIGKKHMASIAETLKNKAHSIKIVELPGLAEKEDVSDWLTKYDHSIDELERIVNEAAEYDSTRKAISESPQRTIFMNRFYPRPFTEEIINRYKFFAAGTTEKDDLYYFDEGSGLWKRDAVNLIAHYFRTESSLDDSQKKTEVVRQIEMDIRGVVWQKEKTSLPEPNLELIPCANGTFDLRTGSVRPFTPEDYFTWKLPWDFNSNSNDEFISLMESFVPPERISDLWELLAYLLWRDYSYQKFFFLFGRGSNGKSLFQNLCVNLCGKENVASLSLDEIQGNKFAAIMLHDKLVNVSGEVNYHDLENTRLLKELTGEDVIMADRKYLNPIQFKNHAKMVFLTNQIPKTHDTTDGFYRRAYLIEFPKQFTENPLLIQRVNDLGKTRSQHEGLLFEVLNRLKNLKARKFVFTNHRSSETMKKEYESLSNPLTQFVETCCEKRVDSLIPKSHFKEKFNGWLRGHGFNAYSDTRLGLEMKELGFEEGRRQYAGTGERVNCWLGVCWKP